MYLVIMTKKGHATVAYLQRLEEGDDGVSWSFSTCRASALQLPDDKSITTVAVLQLAAINKGDQTLQYAKVPV